MSDEFVRAPGGVFFKELRVLLSMHFVTLSFSHVPRTCNSCAHELAQVGFCRDPDQPAIWSDPLPAFVRLMLDRELADPRSG